jgi:NitT/TauT family transport system permease protein
VAGWLTPKEPIPAAVYAIASALTVSLLLGGWAVLAYGGYVRPEFLPAPHQVILAAIRLIRDGELWTHVRASCFVIFLGFALASMLAVPLGILMGSFSLVEALIEPVIDFVRYH